MKSPCCQCTVIPAGCHGQDVCRVPCTCECTCECSCSGQPGARTEPRPEPEPEPRVARRPGRRNSNPAWCSLLALLYVVLVGAPWTQLAGGGGGGNSVLAAAAPATQAAPLRCHVWHG